MNGLSSYSSSSGVGVGGGQQQQKHEQLMTVAAAADGSDHQTIIMAAAAGGGGAEVTSATATATLEQINGIRTYRSGDEYLWAMREDLADWLQRLYAHLRIDCDNFFDVLEDGVALCRHANNVRKAALAHYEANKQQQQQRQQQRKFSAHCDIPDVQVLYRTEAKAKSFMARDNVANFIVWCRLLGIYECLLFETDDLVLRKNDKSFILCLLEVARRGAAFGMPAPLLVQFEQEIDREMALDDDAEAAAAAAGAGATDGNEGGGKGEGEEEEELIEYGPQPQIVTNDLRSLDEMVRDLVENCSCPSQFAMVRISEGKYRIGETKMLIFVRVLRNHVMVRVGGGWDTLSHYLEKHDPCRCRAGHRTAIGSRLSVSHSSNGGAPQMAVSYDRTNSPPPPPSQMTTFASSSASNSRRSSSSSTGGGGIVSSSSRKNSMTPLGQQQQQQFDFGPRDAVGRSSFRSTTNPLAVSVSAAAAAARHSRSPSPSTASSSRRFSYGAMQLTTSKRTPSPGPSMTSTPMTMTGAASGFQRTGSGRNWSSSATNQHQPTTTTTTTTFHQIALQLQQQQQQQQNNLDSLESCDSGVSLASPSGAVGGTKTTIGSGSLITALKQKRTGLSLSLSSSSSRGGGGEGGGGCGGDNDGGSDVGSDDGYRTTSEASSSNGPIPSTTPTPPPPPNRAGSKIPFFLGSLRGLGNGGGSSKSLTNGNDDYAAGGMSLATKTPTRADSFGRHSLRMRSLRMTPVSSSPSSTPTGIPMPIYNNNNNKSTTNSGNSSSNTWNGRRLRQRPSLQPDSFIAPSSSSDRGSAQHQHHRSRSITSTSSLWKQQQQPLSSPSPSGSGGYSSSHYNNYNNGYSRATSTSPSTTRRNYYNNSSSSSGGGGCGSGGNRSNWSTPAQSPEYRSTAPDWGSVAGASLAVQQPTATTKMSPLLRDMLDDVEVDNDASILRKMEQIVNQYKARVENLLAKEGKTLHDDDWTVPPPPPPPALVPTPTAAAAVVDTQLTATDRSRNTPAAAPAAPPGSPLPSRIPKPLFVYRPKETCL